jgi:hypothetical protein
MRKLGKPKATIPASSGQAYWRESSPGALIAGKNSGDACQLTISPALFPRACARTDLPCAVRGAWVHTILAGRTRSHRPPALPKTEVYSAVGADRADPGASHTRFEHSLGVMEMATRIFDRLAVENGAQMEETFAEVEALRDDTMARARQLCRLAALLHDVGHCCFSHAAEKVIHKDSDHESLTVVLLTTPHYLKDALDQIAQRCRAIRNEEL